MMAVAFHMKQAFASIENTKDFGDMICDFLDRFRTDPHSILIAEEPALLAPILDDDGLADAYPAATAACSHKLRMLLLQESPSEFRLRNLFVSANALHRA